MSLSELIDIYYSNELIGTETFSKLRNNETLFIGEQLKGLNENEHFYIKRSINMPCIDTDIREDSTVDCIYAFSQFSELELRSFLPEYTEILKVSSYSLTGRFYILDENKAEAEFQKLCPSNTIDIHWFKKSNNEFQWHKSRGDLDDMRKFNKYLKKTEEELIQESERDIFIISDSAGMGKSTFLTKISNDLKAKNKSSWIFKLILNDFTKQFHQIKRDPSLKELLENEADEFIEYFLKNFTNLKSDLERKLFKFYIRSPGRDIIILLDGFDEISPFYEEVVIDFIKQLKQIATNIWITTRPVTENKLKDELMSLSFTLEPLTKKDQILFLASKWNTADQSDIKFIECCAENLIENLLEENEHDQIFTSNPLHLDMLTEIYQDNFKQFHADYDKFTLSLTELYERFVQMKFEIYCVEKKKQDLTNPGIISDNEQLMDSFLTRHQKFAVYSTLKELENNIEMRDSEHPFIDSLVPIEIICAQQLCRPKILENILTAVELENISSLHNEKTGIIDFIDNKFRFIHKSFTEYFTSRFLLENIQKENIRDILIEYVLIETEFDSLRKFLDSTLKKQRNQRNIVFNRTKTEEYFKSVHLAAFEGNEHIVRFLVDILNQDQREKLFQSQYSFDYLEVENYNLLVNAACNEHSTIVKYLIEKGYDVNSDFNNIMNQVSQYSEFDKNELLCFLIENSFININNQDENGDSLAHYAAKRNDIEMLEILIAKGINFSLRNQKGLTAIENIISVPVFETFAFDLKNVYNFLLVYSSYLTLESKLILAIHFEDLHSLKEYLNEPFDLNRIIGNYGPISFKACQTRNIEIVELLKEKGCDFQKKWNKIEQFDNTAYNWASQSEYQYSSLEVACTSSKIETINFLIKEIKCEITPVAIKGALHNLEEEIIGIFFEENNVNLNCLVEDGLTPLLYVVRLDDLSFSNCSKTSLIEILVNNGANLLANDGRMGNALHIAAFKGKCDFINTLLTLAVEKEQLEKLLQSFNGKNAYQIAFKNNNFEAANILKDFFADCNQQFDYQYTSEEKKLHDVKTSRDQMFEITGNILLGIDLNRKKIKNLQSENY